MQEMLQGSRLQLGRPSTYAKLGPVRSTWTQREQADHIDQQATNCQKVEADGSSEGKNTMSTVPGRIAGLGLDIGLRQLQCP